MTSPSGSDPEGKHIIKGIPSLNDPTPNRTGITVSDQSYNKDLVPFDYEGQTVRTVLVNGEPWFISLDVLDLLELNRSSVALLDGDETRVHTVYSNAGPRQMTIISESGLYSFIFRSKKLEAKRIRKWITSEVLPSIRKTGGYGSTDTDRRIEDLIRRVDELRADTKALRSAKIDNAAKTQRRAKAAVLVASRQPDPFLLERCSIVIEQRPDIKSSEIYAIVGGKRTLAIAALFVLEEQGYVKILREGRAYFHRSLKPYRMVEPLELV